MVVGGRFAEHRGDSWRSGRTPGNEESPAQGGPPQVGGPRVTAVGRGVASARALPVVCVPLSCQLLGPVPALRAPSPRSALLLACRTPPPTFGADSASPAAAGGLEPGVSLAGPCGPSFTSVLPGPCSPKTRLRGRCVPRTGRKPVCHVCVRGSCGAWTGLRGAQNGACPPTGQWAGPPPPLVLCPPEMGALRV